MKRKLIMWNIMTLDGYFEGTKEWDLSFHENIWGPETEELSLQQLESADFLVFGRKTYEGMAAYWKNEKGSIADLMNSIPKIVVSRTLKSADWNNTTLIRGDISNEIKRLKEEGSKDMYVFGSANLSETLMNENLFDEYRIGISPVILGNGNPLFKKDLKSYVLNLSSANVLKNGGVILTYTPKSEN